MAGINVRRVIVGGLVAGVVANVFDFVIASYLIKADLDAMGARLHLSASDAWPSAIGIFIGTDLVWGVLLVFTYAAIRPRFGPGPKTAILSGILPWVAIAILTLQLSAVGIRTLPSYLKAAALYLISAIVTGLVGAMLYKEEPQLPSH
jgi:hypothetical protein